MRFDIYHHFHERELLMTIFSRLEALEPLVAQAQADIAALKAAPSSGVTADQLAAVQTQVDALRADVGTPAVAPTA